MPDLFPIPAAGRCIAALLLTLGAGVASAHGVHHHAAPTVIEEPSVSQAAAQRPPRDEVQELLQAFRRSGDDAYLETAEQTLEAALAEQPGEPRLLVDAALVAQAQHRFDVATGLVRKALAIRPNDDQAWLLLASIHLVLGETGEAGVACDRLRTVPPLVQYTCRARVAHARGDVTRTLARLERLLEVPQLTGNNDEWTAWSLAVAGDLAVAAEEPSRAIDFYRQSLMLGESAQVRAALVDVLLAADDIESASEELAHGSTALPLQVRRLIVATRRGDSRYADQVRHMDEEFRRWISDQDWLHAREMARFYLDVVGDTEVARSLARINLAIQREPEDLLLADRTGAEAGA